MIWRVARASIDKSYLSKAKKISFKADPGGVTGASPRLSESRLVLACVLRTAGFAFAGGAFTAWGATMGVGYLVAEQAASPNTKIS